MVGEGEGVKGARRFRRRTIRRMDNASQDYSSQLCKSITLCL